MPTHVIKVQVKINGQTEIKGDDGSVSLKDGGALKRFMVDLRLDAPAYFSIDLQLMSSGDFVLVDAIAPADEVEILAGYEEELTIMKGEVAYVEPSFSANEQTLTIGGYDLLHRLTRGTQSRSVGDGVTADQKIKGLAGDVVNKAAAREGDASLGLKAVTGDGGSAFEYMSQVDISDFAFLRTLGSSGAISFDTRAGEDSAKLAFKQVDIQSAPSAVICREKPDPSSALIATRADFSLSTVRQVGAVEVRGYNVREKKAVVGKATSSSSVFPGKAGHKVAGKALYGSESAGPVLTVVDVPVVDADEAKILAQSIFDELSMSFQTAEVVVEGDPTLVPGDVVEMKDFGERYSGKYLIRAAVHQYAAESADPYTVRLSLERNATPKG